jgi:hypothetical protein
MCCAAGAAALGALRCCAVALLTPCLLLAARVHLAEHWTMLVCSNAAAPAPRLTHSYGKYKTVTCIRFSCPKLADLSELFSSAGVSTFLAWRLRRVNMSIYEPLASLSGSSIMQLCYPSIILLTGSLLFSSLSAPLSGIAVAVNPIYVQPQSAFLLSWGIFLALIYCPIVARY